MAARRLLVLFLVVTLFVSVLHAERARNDDLESDEEEEIDFVNHNTDNNREGIIYSNLNHNIFYLFIYSRFY